jgi:HEAT repeat protein
MTFLIAGLLVQADTIPDCIRELNSDLIDVRTVAAKRLALAGSAAVPELEKVTRGSNPEAAALARSVLSRIADLHLLTDALARALPDARNRVAAGLPGWGSLFLEASQLPGLGRVDLEPLAVRALRAATPGAEAEQFRDLCVFRQLKAAWPEFMRRVRQFDPQTCYLWIQRVGELGALEAAPDLMGLLKDPAASPWRSTLFQALARLEAREAVPIAAALVSAEGARIGGQGNSDVDAALALVVELDAGQALRLLVPLASNPQTSFKTFPILRSLHLGEALEVAVRFSQPRAGYQQYQGRELLRSLGSREAIPYIMPFLEDPDPQERAQAVMALGGLHARSAVPALKARLEDPSGDVRRRAAAVLARMGLRDGVPELVMALRVEDQFLRPIEAIADSGAPQAAPILQELLTPDSPRRGEAALALGRLGAVQAGDALRRLLRDPDAGVRLQAGEGLLALLGARARVDFRPLVDEGGVWAAGLLADAASLEGTSELMKGLDGSPELKAETLTRLGQIGVPEARARVSRELELNPRNGLVAFTAANLGLKESLPYLRERAHKGTPWDRMPAEDAICALGEHESIPEILRRPSEAWSGFVLNAARRPDLWAGWDELRVKVPFKGPAFEAIDHVARQAGLGVEWPSTGDEPWMFAMVNVSSPGRSVRRVLADLLAPGGGGILEEGKLRILSRRDARRFWRLWWANGRIKEAVEPDKAEIHREIEALEADIRGEREARAALVRKKTPLDVPLTPSLLAIPGLADRIKKEGNAGCAAILLESVHPDTRKAYRLVPPADLEVLFPAAMQGARSHADLISLCYAMRDRRLLGASHHASALLSHTAPEVRAVAARCLAELKGRDAFGELLPLLKDPFHSVQIAVIEIIGEKGTREEHAPLLLARAQESHLRLPVACALATLRAPEAIPILVEMSDQNGGGSNQNRAVMYLRYMGGAAQIPHMRSLVLKYASADPNTSNYALQFLASWGVTEAAKEIDAVLSGEDRPMVMFRTEAVKAVGELGLRQAVPHLIRLLEKGDDAPVPVLADMGIREAIPALRPLLEKEYRQGPVIRALAELGDRESVPRLRRLLEHKYSETRDQAALGLALLGDRESFPRFEADLRSRKKESLSSEALQALHHFKMPGFKAFLLERMTYVPYRVEDLVAETLGEDLLPILQPWLDNEDRNNRYRALQVLGRVKGTAALRASEALLQDHDYPRFIAAENVCRQGERKGAAPLLEAGRTSVVLNAIRAPALWKSLESLVWEGPAYTPYIEHYGRIAKQAGLTLEIPPMGSDCLHPLSGRFKRLQKAGAPATLAWAVEALEDERWCVVLEDKRMRLLPREEGLRFWKAWLKEGK